MNLKMIVSGGQTGVDRGALDAALAADFPCGGWCPEGFKAEDGRIPDQYPLVVLTGSGYRERTLKNVQDSDGTLIIFNQALTGGTKLTRDLRVREKKPFLLVNAAETSGERTVTAVSWFVEENEIAVLNVAGPRASGWAEGYGFALTIVGK